MNMEGAPSSKESNSCCTANVRSVCGCDERRLNATGGCYVGAAGQPDQRGLATAMLTGIKTPLRKIPSVRGEGEKQQKPDRYSCGGIVPRAGAVGNLAADGNSPNDNSALAGVKRP